jgi:hypothetical protein
MGVSFSGGLDALGRWRAALGARIDELGRYLREHELLDAASSQLIDSIGERLAGDKLVLAFVAEFSRGKSELINAIFFADTGRRVLPATPGRTTMCPVELGYEAGEAPSLALLPVDTRLEARSLAELRTQPQAWVRRPLAIDSPDELVQALSEVKRTKRVSVDDARALGFWSDDAVEDNPPVEGGGVEVPLWRHALINYPHPLLERGLVVLDTPGLNAIGAEPELTLGLLPSAHATVFILGADTGVTKSDLAIWRDHLGAQSRSRYVALNKIDTLSDPLTPPAEVLAQIERQRHEAARTLGVAVDSVFPISARQALTARVAGNEEALAESRLPHLEHTLATQLLPQRRQVLEQVAVGGAQQLESHLARHLGDRRRQLAEQVLELRGLRGKSGAKLRTMLQRVEIESAEFERCTARLHALRAVHGRMVKAAMRTLSGDDVPQLVTQMHESMSASLLGLGARRAFADLCAKLRALVVEARQRSVEIERMLAGSFSILNTDFGFSLATTPAPDFTQALDELEMIERNYSQYLGMSQALRLAQPKFREQFRRMLLSRVRLVFERASGELEQWNKTASSHVDVQLRERRHGFKRRHEALERIQAAAGELEQRIAEFEQQDQRLQRFQGEIAQRLQSLRQLARGDAPAASLPAAPHDAFVSEAPRLAQA